LFNFSGKDRVVLGLAMDQLELSALVKRFLQLICAEFPQVQDFRESNISQNLSFSSSRTASDTLAFPVEAHKLNA